MPLVLSLLPNIKEQPADLIIIHNFAKTITMLDIVSSEIHVYISMIVQIISQVGNSKNNGNKNNKKIIKK